MSVKIDLKKCVGCGICIEFCPAKALFNCKGKTYVNDKCNRCGNCQDVCVVCAITIE